MKTIYEIILPFDDFAYFDTYEAAHDFSYNYFNGEAPIYEVTGDNRKRIY